MSDTVISIDGLGKKYRLGVIGTGRLSQDLTQWWAKIRGKEDPFKSIEQDNFKPTQYGDYWALKDISFNVNQGEVLGIIGKNGAGKSTLLKILSRVTSPTTGIIKAKGRIASLLEVGTGFHPELTGRENIFLNGAILGMTKAEIRGKIDEIIDFSGVEKHIDTPVKRYSSGMYVRLAFAVAAHLEPEILIVDEVLAVGDAEFQKKCLGKLGQVSKEGRTILFVSHNMGAVQALCSRAILLQAGNLTMDGPTNATISTYSEIAFNKSKAVWLSEPGMTGVGKYGVKINAVRVLDQSHQIGNILNDNDPFFIEIEFETNQNGNQLTSNIQLFSESGILILSSGNWPSTTTNIDKFSNVNLNAGTYRSRVKIPKYFLNEGGYFINALINREASTSIAFIEEAVSFTIVDSGNMRKEYTDYIGGLVRPKFEWNTEMLGTN
ncbi:ABC transporter ATP-binding protein [Cyclobacterium sp. 1_MG-2023]|uniref:ABC transporter ATP-binding protein n=1 Tax=Cyclobacterium sp. 1_MG-2023 TaxID=3062681 RepID=UPI0026E22364|nr:ABC transporter ATP-binding protein [Cyclobacterium sp. 1_MG-2023]MDO6436232.1 ABC transporter ATP-binding protein [Cyclobacterium sp. 1_MG-2023]